MTDIHRVLGDQDAAAPRAIIRELYAEKEYYTQRYLEEKRKCDELLEKINSNSTLGSLLLSTATDDSVAFWDRRFGPRMMAASSQKRRARGTQRAEPGMDPLRKGKLGRPTGAPTS
jgi:hypothetical protein